ncbi:hypothetical protein LB465_10770 [Salegentibacter sp. LM13S]|uniref:hypothetical protein n=1 Tax=Salegentibacter lacus TaxID=2873599 RepID=UPI001CCBC4A1|nr:hypothetical protein [Salegentibacter lacus]MBZ9631261.1 hypothetical protein [Salegentibacter lacus]
MTRKFRRAVKRVVADGKVTDEERKAIFDMAKEENLKTYEVQIYLSSELKKRQAKIEKQKYNREKRKTSGSWLNNEAVKTSATAAALYGIKKAGPHVLKAGKRVLPIILKVVTRGKI